MTNADEMFTSIVGERGGPDALSAIDLAIARSLSIALATEPINPLVVSQLTGLLPPVTKPSGSHVDLAKLSDADLNRLERLVRKATIAGPPAAADTPEGRVAQMLEINKQALALADGAKARIGNAKRLATMWQQRALAAEAELARLQTTSEAIPASPVEENAPAPSRPRDANVIPLRSGPELPFAE